MHTCICKLDRRPIEHAARGRLRISDLSSFVDGGVGVGVGVWFVLCCGVGLPFAGQHGSDGHGRGREAHTMDGSGSIQKVSEMEKLDSESGNLTEWSYLVMVKSLSVTSFSIMPSPTSPS